MYIQILKVRIKSYEPHPDGGWIGTGERIDIADYPSVQFHASDAYKEAHPLTDIIHVSHLPEGL
jgi:hypothetical protein